MNIILKDYMSLGFLSFTGRALGGLRGLIIMMGLKPAALGEYTVWLLYVFYFSILDLGTFKGLERDIPHYTATGDNALAEQTARTGWSSYALLCLLAAVLLTVLTLVLYRDLLLSLLLGLYLLCDKWYRAYDSNTRIHLQYRDNGVAQIITAAVSLAAVWLLLPRFGMHGIFIALTAGSAAAALFLARACPIAMHWTWSPNGAWVFIKSCIPLALVAYAIEFFHAAMLTILAARCDKEHLGHFAFAFRIFQIFLAVFPYMIQDILRTRMYSAMAVHAGVQERLRPLLAPLGAYALATVALAAVTGIAGEAVIERVAPAYLYAMPALKILVLSLLPLGLAKVMGDYLSARLVGQAWWVGMAWGCGIALQAAAMLFMFDPATVIITAPCVYLGASLFVFALIAGRVYIQER